MHPQHLVHPHFLGGSSMDGLLGVVVCDEVDGEPVLMSVGHGNWRAERDRRIITKHVRKLEDLDFVELERLLSIYGYRY